MTDTIKEAFDDLQKSVKEVNKQTRSENRKQWLYTNIYTVCAILIGATILVGTIIGLSLSPMPSWGIILIVTPILALLTLIISTWHHDVGVDLNKERRKMYTERHPAC